MDNNSDNVIPLFPHREPEGPRVPEELEGVLVQLLDEFEEVGFNTQDPVVLALLMEAFALSDIDPID